MRLIFRKASLADRDPMATLVRRYFQRHPERIGPRERRLLLDLEEHEAYHRSPLFSKAQGAFQFLPLVASKKNPHVRRRTSLAVRDVTRSGRIWYGQPGGPRIPGPVHPPVPHTRAPLVVSYGAGVDSTAMLVEMQKRGIRPDLIMFADTGGEKPETMAYLEVMQAWTARVGFPPIVVVRNVPPKAPYATLEEACLTNETVPSMAMGGHSCSLAWKVAPQHRYLAQWQPALDAWARGERIQRAIGYDDSDADRARADRMDRVGEREGQDDVPGRPTAVTMAIGLDDSPADRVRKEKAQGTYAAGKDDAQHQYWYPLQDWHITREQAMQVIADAGLPIPIKSACFFCPSSKKHELDWLSEAHPDMAARAVALEEQARTGKHGFTRIKGLGRSSFAWKDYMALLAAAKPRKSQLRAQLGDAAHLAQLRLPSGDTLTPLGFAAHWTPDELAKIVQRTGLHPFDFIAQLRVSFPRSPKYHPRRADRRLEDQAIELFNTKLAKVDVVPPLVRTPLEGETKWARGTDPYAKPARKPRAAKLLVARG